MYKVTCFIQKDTKKILRKIEDISDNHIKKSSKINYYLINHNYNKILKSDWLSTALISALIGQFDRTVRVMPK